MESEIGVKEFLDFLSLACKVNTKVNPDEIENINDTLNELVSNPLITQLFEQFSCIQHKQEHQSITVQKKYEDGSIKNSNDDYVNVDNFNKMIDLLKNKLNELLNEGLLDSVLTYLHSTPNKPPTAKPNSVIGRDNHKSPKKKKEKKKKVTEPKKLLPKHEVDVEIHVHEGEGLKKLFKCPQSLLVAHMGYFSEINKDRKLEEMDITVHCEISTFEWLMKWVKRNSIEASSTSEMSPRLDYKNVVSIMISANCLKMNTLFQDCLHFCKFNLNEIIKFSPNLSCLSDPILKKLADILNNIEVQKLKDRADKIKSNLFCKLITSLNEIEPSKQMGHYSSSAYLYSCLNCSKLVTEISAPYVPCQVQYITINCNGDVIFNHSRNPNWNLNEYIKNIWTEYKSWSKTYWRLWSQCHFLYCDMCSTKYSVAFSDCCPYHPQQPHFYPVEQFQTTSSPIGRYPCCGSRAIRYETIAMRSGCKLRSHIPKLLTNDDSHILKILDLFPDLIKIKCDDDNVAPFVENYDDLANYNIIFRNISTVDKHERNSNQGLLNKTLVDAHLKIMKLAKSVNTWECKNPITVQNLRKNFATLDIASMEESENSDASFTFDLPVTNDQNAVINLDSTELRASQNEYKPTWTSRYSNRHNQDNQRDYEEIAFQAMSEVLLQHINKRKRFTFNENSLPAGGTYAKIESEWKESHLTKMSYKYKYFNR